MLRFWVTIRRREAEPFAAVDLQAKDRKEAVERSLKLLKVENDKGIEVYAIQIRG